MHDAMFRISFPITLNFSPFAAYSVYCQMCSHPHTVIQVTLCYQHWIMILTLKYLLSPSFLAQTEVDSHIILLNFSHGSRKCIQLTYLKIAMSKPRCSLVNQVLLCSFECSYLYNSSENVPLLEYAQRYTWDRKVGWSNSGQVNHRLVHCIFNADLWVILLDSDEQHLQSSINDAVCLISSPTCSWWLPSSSWIAGHAISPKISH